MIQVKASYYGGFEHDINPHTEGLSQSTREKLFLGEFDESYMQNVVSTAWSVDANGVGCNLPPQAVSRSL